MNSTDVFERYAQLDPATEADARPDWDTVGPVLLAAIDERKSGMQTIEKTEPRKTPPRYRGVLVAAAAFAVVVAVGAVLLMLSDGGDAVAPSTSVTVTTAPTTPTTQAPATTTPPTTSAAPTTAPATGTAEQEQVVDTFIGAMNDGDVSALMSMFTADAEIGDGGIPGADQVNVIQPDEREAFLTWIIDSLPTTYEVDQCDFGTTRVSCRVNYTNALVTAALDRPGTQTHVFDIEDGRIVSYAIIMSAMEANASIHPFVQWIEANRPEALDVIYVDAQFSDRLNLTDESAQLFRELAEEYVASLDG